MKIECGDIEEFCVELGLEGNNRSIHRGIVRVRVDKTPQQQEQVTFDVTFWATALIVSPDLDHVLEFGGHCGVDDVSAQDTAGSELAEAWKQQVQRVCDAYDLSLRRGKIEL